MCNPVAGAVIGGGTALLGGAYEDKAQDLRHRFEKQQYKATITSANVESFEQYAALQERDVQETAAASESIKQAGVASYQARAAVTGGAAASGVAGNSVASMIDEVTAGETEYVSGIIRNRVWGQGQLQRQADAVRGDTYQRILGALPRTPKSNKFNIFLKGVQGAIGGASAGAAFQ